MGTSDDLKSTKNYYDYGDAVGAYIDHVSGSVFLIRSTSANIELKNVQMESYSGVLVQTVLNSDSMGNFLAAGDGEQVNPIAVTMTNMEASGDILHEDYQRRMTVELNDATLSGNIISGTMDSWNDQWNAYGAVNWVVDDSYETQYGVELTVGKGGVWNVTGESTLTSLTVDEGGTINGEITLDGAPLTPEPGVVYEGAIMVSGDYVPEEETEEETSEASAREPLSQVEEEAQTQEPATPQETETVPNPSVGPIEETSGPNTALIVAMVVLLVAAVGVVIATVVRKKKRPKS